MRRFVLSLAAAAGLAGCSDISPARAPQRMAAAVGQSACEWCAAAVPLSGEASDYDRLLASIGEARVVALGENTHGTHEFYRERARITQRLMSEKNFRALVIEADWPDTDRINRYVRGTGNDRSAVEALGAYQDFPRWMWRNAEFAQLVEQLRAHNLTRPESERVGVYGMDVYNFFGAMDAVRRYVRQQHPHLESRVQQQYRCFARYKGSPESYGLATRSRSRSCATQAQAVQDLLSGLPIPSEVGAREDRFAAIRSAASVAGAEEYYRTTYSGSNSWNVRDRRMVRTIGEVARHVGGDVPGKVVVWAHNSHVGDARATDAPLRGELNVGQLLREAHGSGAFLVGFLTHRGTVIAATEWDSPGLKRELRPALPESYSGMFHAAGLRNALFVLRRPDAKPAPARPLLQRAVGVIYRPGSERASHYFHADLGQQFDAALFFAETRAVTPL